MATSKKKMFLRVCVFLMAVFMVVMSAVSPVVALNKDEYNRYAQNSIYFYDPDGECIPGEEGDDGEPGEPFDGGEKWDGSCSTMTQSRIDWVKKYLSALKTKASENGIPWELIPAQVFQESGGGKHEACANNPLGLKAKKGHAKCSNGFAKFSSYEEAFQYYMDSIIPINELKGKYPQDPYSAVSFIQYGASRSYASCDSLKYKQCVGHMGEPTPGYVQGVSSLICGIQKWAESEGIKTSRVTYKNKSSDSSGSSNSGENDSGSSDDENNEDDEDNDEDLPYCDDDDDDDDESEEPEAGNLASYVKAWVWPTYRKGTLRTSDYAKYMDNEATYTGATCADGAKGVDCGAFVSNIIRASGWDSNYPLGPTSTQSSWLANNWKKIEDIKSLKLGDVGIKPGHVILYIGDIAGFGSKTASASDCRGPNRRAPSAGSPNENLNQYTWYRKK